MPKQIGPRRRAMSFLRAMPASIRAITEPRQLRFRADAIVDATYNETSSDDWLTDFDDEA